MYGDKSDKTKKLIRNVRLSVYLRSQFENDQMLSAFYRFDSS